MEVGIFHEFPHYFFKENNFPSSLCKKWLMSELWRGIKFSYHLLISFKKMFWFFTFSFHYFLFRMVFMILLKQWPNMTNFMKEILLLKPARFNRIQNESCFLVKSLISEKLWSLQLLQIYLLLDRNQYWGGIFVVLENNSFFGL